VLESEKSLIEEVALPGGASFMQSRPAVHVGGIAKAATRGRSGYKPVRMEWE
jgi:hypothetical protein